METKEDKWTIIIENANTQIHLIFTTALTKLLTKDEMKSQALTIINQMVEELTNANTPSELIMKAERAAKLRFVDWYNILLARLTDEAKSSQNEVIKAVISNITQTKGMVVANDGDYIEGTMSNLRDYMSTGETGASQTMMDGYMKSVRKTISEIGSKNITVRDKLGRKMSLRNLAEMTARFEETREHLQSLKEQGLKIVLASSHNNASKRCQIWQGKLFLLDVEPTERFTQNVDVNYKPVPIGKIDGINYYSLADAMKHGFLGYNCRHRLVKYQKGMDLFKKYPNELIECERGLELKQRSLERRIRECKRNVAASPTLEDRKKWRIRSEQAQEEYDVFCAKHHLTKYPMRTRVLTEERELLG